MIVSKNNIRQLIDLIHAKYPREFVVSELFSIAVDALRSTVYSVIPEITSNEHFHGIPAWNGWRPAVCARAINPRLCLLMGWFRTGRRDEATKRGVLWECVHSRNACYCLCVSKASGMSASSCKAHRSNVEMKLKINKQLFRERKRIRGKMWMQYNKYIYLYNLQWFVHHYTGCGLHIWYCILLNVDFRFMFTTDCFLLPWLELNFLYKTTWNRLVTVQPLIIMSNAFMFNNQLDFVCCVSIWGMTFVLYYDEILTQLGPSSLTFSQTNSGFFAHISV